MITSNKEKRSGKKRTTTQTIKESNIPQIVKIKVQLANIRSTPDSTHDDNIVKVVCKGATFKRVNDGSTNDLFVPIDIEGTKCYVMRDIVEIYDNPAYTANNVEAVI